MKTEEIALGRIFLLVRILITMVGDYVTNYFIHQHRIEYIRENLKIRLRSIKR